MSRQTGRYSTLTTMKQIDKMVFTTAEYGAFYGTYKNEEAEALDWIKARAAPNPNGKPHAYSYCAKLAEQVHSKGFIMPQAIRDMVETAVSLRYLVLRDHQERGKLEDECHEYCIRMLATIAGIFMSVEQADRVLEQLPANLRHVSLGPPPPPKFVKFCPQDLKGSWRPRRQSRQLPSPPPSPSRSLDGPWRQPVQTPSPPPMTYARCVQQSWRVQPPSPIKTKLNPMAGSWVPQSAR